MNFFAYLHLEQRGILAILLFTHFLVNFHWPKLCGGVPIVIKTRRSADAVCAIYFSGLICYFHSAHPTGWAESISGIGLCVCVCVCMYVRHHFEDDHYFCL